MRPNIFTVPAGQPFLDTLAEALLAGNLPAIGGVKPSAISLPKTTLLMPTRRASRGLQDAFLRASGGKAMLLPAIKPISEGDEDKSLLATGAGYAAIATGDGVTDIPPAISPMERHLVLTNMVMRWSASQRAALNDGNTAAGAGTPAQCANLAKELARLMDMVETEGVSLIGLEALVPEDFAEHWAKTISFLDIVLKSWPHYLSASGFVSATGRRNMLILAEAARLNAMPASGPVIVAGVTGSIPATVALMKAVASQPLGAIVLPALDTDLDEDSWQQIVPAHPEHPQYGLKTLLDGLGLSRSDVQLLGADTNNEARKRRAFISETMRPAATTSQWHHYAAGMRRATATLPLGLEHVNLIEAPNAQDEAEAVALILREALEKPGRTAALVSPDRLLARRVAVRLESWGIKVDDSAGRPFAKTPPGAFFDLVIEAIDSDFTPAAVMALLKHPLTRLGLDPFSVRRAARVLELAAFRGPYLGSGIDSISKALERAAFIATPGATRTERAHVSVRRLFADDWTEARRLVQLFEAAFAPLAAVYANRGQQTLTAFVAAHLQTAQAIARLPEQVPPAAPDQQPAQLQLGLQNPSESSPTDEPLWVGEAGETAERFFSSMLASGLPELVISSSDYADLYRGLVAGENVRPRIPVHPRLNIWGPFEARLQQPDVVVLGSLNDGTWPESADPGPWLNRPMRASLGLPSPEEQIGFAAHDFTSLLGAPVVYLTRSLKIDGVPAVPSRWLLRISALLSGIGAGAALVPDQPWLAWARIRDAAPFAKPAPMPAPKPPVHMRPRKMSVSRVEKWQSNPYEIFASEILGLEPLDEIGLPPQPSLRGSMIHEALSRFAAKYPDRLPTNSKDELLRYAREVLDEYLAHPRVAAFWVPRFERFAEWFAETEPERRRKSGTVLAEKRGKLSFETAEGPFELTARADRIDVTANGLIITDYKTGAPPKAKEVTDGLRPQLPLEAAIATDANDLSGFENTPKIPVVGLKYIHASGGQPAGAERNAGGKLDITAHAAEQLEGLKRLVRQFDQVTTPYSPNRRSGKASSYDRFAHLARTTEWSGTDDDSDGD
jgi:ATP-dependent helicase/nuclease subunit B